jgi:hypothetical protein
MAATRVREAGRSTLAPRWVVAEETERNETQIRRYLRPVACDVTNRTLLYDLAAAKVLLARVPRRERRAA